MSALRSHDDTWDIATSVGSTAVMVAAARASETESPGPADPRSVRPHFDRRAGTGMWEAFLDDSPDRQNGRGPEATAVLTNMLNYQAVRTHFFDAYFRGPDAASGRS